MKKLKVGNYKTDYEYEIEKRKAKKSQQAKRNQRKDRGGRVDFAKYED